MNSKRLLDYEEEEKGQKNKISSVRGKEFSDGTVLSKLQERDMEAQARELRELNKALRRYHLQQLEDMNFYTLPSKAMGEILR